MVDPGLLHGVEATRSIFLADTFNGRDLFVGHRADRDLAAANRFAVDVDRAGAARRDATTVLCAG